MTKGKKKCPCCGFHLYRGSYKGRKAYRCAKPRSGCEWNREWYDDHGPDATRFPIGRTVAQVRRVNAEFSEQ